MICEHFCKYQLNIHGDAISDIPFDPFMFISLLL